jgi:hypothetical protein
MVPISDGNLLPEIAQAAEGLEFIDGRAIFGKLNKTRVKKRLCSSCLPREQGT